MKADQWLLLGERDLNGKEQGELSKSWKCPRARHIFVRTDQNWRPDHFTGWKLYFSNLAPSSLSPISCTCPAPAHLQLAVIVTWSPSNMPSHFWPESYTPPWDPPPPPPQPLDMAGFLFSIKLQTRSPPQIDLSRHMSEGTPQTLSFTSLFPFSIWHLHFLKFVCLLSASATRKQALQD